MMKIKPLSLFILALIFGACSDSSSNTDSDDFDSTSLSGKADQIDESALDKTVNPCEDFYEFACGNWIKKADAAHPSRSFSKLQEQNEKALKSIKQEIATGRVSANRPDAKKASDFYASCVSTDSANSLKALQEDLQKLKSVKDKKALARLVGELHLKGASALFNFSTIDEVEDTHQIVGQISAGGTTKGASFYDNTDMDNIADMAKYLSYVTNTFAELGASKDEAQKASNSVITVERALAGIKGSRLGQAEKIERGKLNSLLPNFDWNEYFAALGNAEIKEVSVSNSSLLTSLNDVLGQISVEDLGGYLQWQLISLASKRNLLGGKLADPSERKCDGQCQAESCSSLITTYFSDVISRSYIEKVLAPKTKEAAAQMIDDIMKAFEQNLSTLSWLDGPTKAAALKKLQKIARKIAYPDEWKSLDDLPIISGNYYANYMATTMAANQESIARIGKPINRQEWLAAPYTPNAYYRSDLNEIVLPAGILQPPFFASADSLPLNYGAIGMVMAHELTHAFDNNGREYDAEGKKTDWWTSAASQEFETRTQCVVEQYNGYITGGQFVDGKKTLGENIADLGGVKFALAAEKIARARRGSALPTVAGYDEEQQFFIAFAQIWCEKENAPEVSDSNFLDGPLTSTSKDPHSPGRFRTNGSLSNTPEFATAFKCAAGSKMAPKNPCAVW